MLFILSELLILCGSTTFAYTLLLFGCSPEQCYYSGLTLLFIVSGILISADAISEKFKKEKKEE